VSHREMHSHVVKTSGRAGTASYAGGTQQELRDERPGVSTPMAVATGSSAMSESPADPARHAHSVKRSASAEISRTAGRQQGKRHGVKQNGSGIDECSWSGQSLLGVQNSRRNLAPSIDLPRQQRRC